LAPSVKKRYLAALFLALAALGLAIGGRAILRRRPQATPSAPEAARSRAATPLDIAQSIYDGKLSPGWDDWGWGQHEFPPQGPVKISFGDYGGIILHHAPLEAHFGGVALRYQVPSDWPEFLAVALKGPAGGASEFPLVEIEPRHVARLEDGWREAVVSFAELDPKRAAFDRVVLSARRRVAAEGVSLDKVGLTRESAAVTTASAAASLELAIACRAPTHRINPLIYGGSGNAWDAAQSAQRIGGNPLTRFNWDLGNAWNAGSDWFFENVKVDGSLRGWLDDIHAHGQAAAMVVPLIGWVAKDTASVGFPKSKFARQRAFDAFRPEAGDGHSPDGAAVQPGPPSETSLAAPPELVGSWVAAVRAHDAASGKRSIGMYILDNEPALWNATHRDVHPKPVSYDELLERSINYGTEIRKADADAMIAGPAEWGWAAYFDSAQDKDTGAARPDRRAHGDTPLIPYYLKTLAEHERRTGTRILDVLDVHFYPAAAGLYGGNARTDPEGAALRIRSTRSLWDPTYVDESWINEAIRLIPRLKAWVAENYPGRLVSLGEWSFGADDHISGGLATAEALGRFGQQGLDAAYFWGGPKQGSAAFWAFRAYRNFDGQGGHFLDVSLTTKDADNVSLFASRDEAGSRIVAVLVNRDPSVEARAQIALDGCGAAVSRRAFVYGAHSDALEEKLAGIVSSGSLEAIVPPYSFEVLDIRLSAPDAGAAK
jgi:Glycoside hydrolase family 44